MIHPIAIPPKTNSSFSPYMAAVIVGTPRNTPSKKSKRDKTYPMTLKFICREPFFIAGFPQYL